MNNRRPVLLAAMILGIWNVSCTAQPFDRGATTSGASGNPLPRFAALDDDQVFMRAGPGKRYPILWDYRRQTLPVVILGESGPWRRVRDPEGTVGWIHTQLMTGQRWVWLTRDTPVLREPAYGTVPILKAETGLTARLQKCQNGWCRITIARKSGWVTADALWGIFTDEAE